MRIVAISDVHVKSPGDEADLLLGQFLTHDLVVNAEYVVLLGDIFDLMCGPHKEYLNKFSHLFELMDKLCRGGAKVIFCEGNHDIHLKKLFKLRWPREEILPIQSPQIELIDGKSYYFSHGDEHEIDNLKYQKYKKFISSKALTFVANYLMPYQVLNFLGERASKISRKKGAKEYIEDVVKHRFRMGVSQTTNGKFNFILGGHSHVKDLFPIQENSHYINNGYALKSRSFIMVENHQISFPRLS